MTDPRNDHVGERLRALDRAIAERAIDPRAREDIRERLVREATTRPLATKLRWWPALAFAAGAALMALVQLGPREHDPPAPAAASRAAQASPPAPTPLPCPPLVEGRERIAAHECRVGSDITLHATRASTLELAGDRLVLVEGELELSVDPRARPLHVLAGGRDIEVIGTRFLVHQREEGGWVALLEGRIRLHMPARESIMMAPGERHGWSSPLAPAASPIPEPEPRPRARARTSDEDVQLPALLAEVATLRREGRFEAAVERLRSVDSSRWSARAQQLVSYEIGTLLERQLGDRVAACEHWRAHAAAYPEGRHARAVASALERLACE